MQFEISALHRVVLSGVFLSMGWAGTAAADDEGWTVTGPEYLDLPEHIEEQDPRAPLEDLIGALHRKGYVGLYVDARPETRTLRIREAKLEPKGDLADYIRSTLSSTRRHLPLIDLAAEGWGGEPKIEYKTVQDGKLPVDTRIEDADRSVYAGMLSSFGGKHSGENIASVVFRTGFKGWIMGGGYTRGIEQISPSESEDGRYDAVQVSARRPTPKGVFLISGAYSESKQGGDLTDFDLNGETYRMKAGWSYPVEEIEPYVHMNHYHQESNIGIANLDGDQQSTALMVGFDADRAFEWDSLEPLTTTFDLSVEHALASDTSGFGLGRDLDSDWTRFAVDVTGDQPLGEWLLTAAAGFQENSGVLPNQRDFVIGGQHRGNGYRAGIATVSDGQYAGIRLFSPNVSTEHTRFRPYVGYNTGRGKPLEGPRRVIESVEIGTVLRLGSHISGEIGFAEVTHDRNIETTESDRRINFNLVAQF